MTSVREIRGGFWLSMLVPISAGALLYFHHPWAFVVGIGVILPLADALVGPELIRSDHSVDSGVWSAGHLIPAFYLAAWLCSLYIGFTRAKDASAFEFIGLMCCCGFLSAFAMAHIHEVMHRADRASRIAANLAFVLAGYPHYRIAHTLHHAHVEDPKFGSVAPVGLSVWKHVGRSFFSAARSSINIEFARARSWRDNRILRIYGIAAIVLVAAFRHGSWRGAAFYVGQGLISAFVVEVIGYLQHYGLAGGAVSLEGQIAWDVNFWLSNRLLSNNGLHTHHHREKTLTYPGLTPAGPALPGGYVHMFWLALIPSLWFSTMRSHTEFLRAHGSGRERSPS